jgi:hypothetical protein
MHSIYVYVPMKRKLLFQHVSTITHIAYYYVHIFLKCAGGTYKQGIDTYYRGGREGGAICYMPYQYPYTVALAIVLPPFFLLSHLVCPKSNIAIFDQPFLKILIVSQYMSYIL